MVFFLKLKHVYLCFTVVPLVEPATEHELKSISDRLKLGIGNHQLKEYKGRL